MADRQADRRRGAWRGGGRRRRAGGDGGFPRHLPGGAVLGQLHPAGVPSRIRPDRVAAAADRGAAGGAADVHRPAADRRAGAGDRPGRLLRAAGPGAGTRRRNWRPRSPSRRRWRSWRRGRRCAAAWRRRWPRRPSANTRSRTGCATPRTSARASRRWRSGGCRTSRHVRRLASRHCCSATLLQWRNRPGPGQQRHHRRADDLALRPMNRPRAHAPGDPIRSRNIPPFEVFGRTTPRTERSFGGVRNSSWKATTGLAARAFRFLKGFVGSQPWPVLPDCGLSKHAVSRRACRSVKSCAAHEMFCPPVGSGWV